MSELQKLKDNIRVLEARIEQEKSRADYWKSRALKTESEEIVHTPEGYKICSRRANCMNKKGSDGILPRSEFYKNKHREDGLQYYCKACLRAAQAKYRLTDKHKTTQREWYKTKKGKNSLKERGKRYSGTDRQKAHGAVSNAIKTGRLKSVSDRSQKCEYCEDVASVYHHYMGYGAGDRLKVVPLCRKCNRVPHK